MTVRIELAGLPLERVLFAPSHLGELAAMLHVLAEPAHHPALGSWAAVTTAGLKPELAERLLEADFLWRSSRADFLLPAVPGGSLTEDLDAVDAIDDETYVRSALVTTCGSSRLTFRTGSPLTDAAAGAEALERAHARGPRQAAFAQQLLDDPTRVRRRVRHLLEDCEQAFFADAWRMVEHQLTADARHKRELLARHGLATAVASVSSAVSYDERRQSIVLDKLQDNTTSGTGVGVTLSPTVFGHPHLLVVHAAGWRPVLQYPAAETRTGSAFPVSMDTVQRRLEALAHPLRLRLCRTLARGPHTTGELASAWQISAPEASRHLAVLKQAGLVSTRRRGRYVLYELDLAAGARLGADFLDAALR